MSAEISGEILKAEREAAELSQEAVAREMGVSAKTVQRLEKAVSVSKRSVTAYRTAVRQIASTRSPDILSRTRFVREETDPFYSADGRGSEPNKTKRIMDFEREMVRLGADDFEADYVRQSARNFLEAIHSHGGTDLDEELELFLKFSLRPWVEERIGKRKREADE